MEAAASGHEIIVQTFLLSVCIVAWQWVRVSSNCIPRDWCYRTQIPFCPKRLPPGVDHTASLVWIALVCSLLAQIYMFTPRLYAVTCPSKQIDDCLKAYDSSSTSWISTQRAPTKWPLTEMLFVYWGANILCILIVCNDFWAHLCVCTVGSYASHSVCLYVCLWLDQNSYLLNRST